MRPAPAGPFRAVPKWPRSDRIQVEPRAVPPECVNPIYLNKLEQILFRLIHPDRICSNLLAMRIDAIRSALLLIDLQERLMPAMEGPAHVVARCAILIEAARRLDVPVLATRQYPKGLGGIVAPLAGLLDAQECHDKLAFSAFAEPAGREALLRPGRDRFVVAGVESHVCVLQTALDLLGEGYAVAVVADAVASRREESRALALERLRRHGAEIVNTEMVVFEWLGRAGTEEFRALSPLIR